MNTPNPSQWAELFEIAMQIIGNANSGHGIGYWAFGGGTSLMLHIGHRTSHDVDIFIDNPQVLPLLNPITQGYETNIVPTAYQTDGSSALKIVFKGIGEIDFITCGDITDNPSYRRCIHGHEVLIEYPGEVLAKKIFYRGARIEPRDIFDIVAAIRSIGFDEIAPSLKHCQEQCKSAIEAIQRQNPEYTELIISNLMNIREDLMDISQVGRDEAIEYLSRIALQ
nr:nucleotidyl transferase AbiEii/AbiGii toxin family protein [uncultured Cohaesibacter sp.]